MSIDMSGRFTELKKEILDKEYSRFNKEQREAIFSVEGPLLILAGAGSGKTTVIVNRIAYMIKYGNAYYSNNIPNNLSRDDITFMQDYLKNPENQDNNRLRKLICDSPVAPFSILAITFTNKAAQEMKERINGLLGAYGEDVWASTFHSTCVKILRREIDKIGYKRSFAIYDSSDSIRLVKECIKALNIDDKISPKTILNAISGAKDALYTPQMYIKEFSVNGYFSKCIGAVYELYQKKLKEANALDFDDLIMLTVKILDEFSEVRDFYRKRFKYILVDEYQDTNHSQYKLISLLTVNNGNICVVGDDDQSIYKFRGATIENILSFEHRFENAKVIRLEQNYRSTQNILTAANEVIKNNYERKGKNLWTNSGDGEKIVIYKAFDQEGEGCFIGEVIKDLKEEEGYKYSDFAVLYRTNAQSRAIENNLRFLKVPAKVISGMSFYERKEIKDMLAYLSVIHNPSDTLRLKRIINEPKRGIGETTVATAQILADSLGVTLFEVAERANEFAPLSKSKEKLIKFAEMINYLRVKSDALPLDELYEELLDKTGYEQSLKKEENSEERIEITEELGSAILIYMRENGEPTLEGFLEEIALSSDIDEYDEAAERVSLMTLHTAKGLEFPVVFIAGMEEGLFPSSMSFDEPKQIEEERRLAYVGFTRAKKRLYLLHTELRTIYGTTLYPQVSRFVKEIPEDLTEVDIVKKLSAENIVKLSNFTGYSLKKLNSSKNPSVTKASPSNFAIGDRVIHKVFGEGMILSAEDIGNDTLMEIAFDKVGTKRLMANFANLKKVQ